MFHTCFHNKKVSVKWISKYAMYIRFNNSNNNLILTTQSESLKNIPILLLMLEANIEICTKEYTYTLAT